MTLFRICFFFFNDTATTEIYTLSLHDALPISFDEWRGLREVHGWVQPAAPWPTLLTIQSRVRGDVRAARSRGLPPRDRKSTRLNSSHANISYAVFCLKKKKKSVANSDGITVAI